jgi:uncharacterized protein
LTNYLADVNVWLALASAGHIHHASARDWFEDEQTASVAFCRVTQTGLLRLLTNSRVMGANVLTARLAWGVYDRFASDGRVVYAVEPPGLEAQWRKVTHSARGGPNFWTDAYLTGFSAMAEVTLVTFDKALAQHNRGRVRLLA